MVVIEDDSGNKVPTADKSCVFFRNGWYYLSWGNNYAMSRKLKGPYRYIGKFPTEDMPASLNLRVNGMLSRKRVKLIFFIEELKSECYLLIKMEL